LGGFKEMSLTAGSKLGAHEIPSAIGTAGIIVRIASRTIPPRRLNNASLSAEFPSQVLKIAIILTGAFDDVAIRHQPHLLLHCLAASVREYVQVVARDP
jgi:hypothetical protein